MKRMMRINRSLVLIVLILLCACKENYQKSIFPDPFLDAFKGKKIKYMVGRRYKLEPLPVVANDTTEFDENGFVNRFKEWGTEIFTTYNDSNFVTRILTLDDIPSNYWISYSLMNGKVIQHWNKLDHLNWDFKTSDIADTLKIVEFEIDRYGRIINSIDNSNDQLTTFEYKDDKLICKTIFSIKDRSDLQTWTYSYKNSQLSTIVVSEENDRLMNYFYEDGLLDSLWTPDFSIRYSYVFRN